MKEEQVAYLNEFCESNEVDVYDLAISASKCFALLSACIYKLDLKEEIEEELQSVKKSMSNKDLLDIFNTVDEIGYHLNNISWDKPKD